MKNFKFSCRANQHIYQRAIDKGLIFYSDKDRLVYYTLAACNSKRHEITVLAGSIMFTHIHQSVTAPSIERLQAYLRDTDSSFSRLYNYRYSRKGRLFGKPTGRAQKFSQKEKRTNIIYIFNNHVEKRICQKALKERWSLLAYALSDHPYSEMIDSRKASGHMRTSMHLVDRRIRKGKALEYCDLDRIFKYLNDVEKEQFTDYVISRYSWIDFNASILLFGSLDSMILAIDSTTGGEYDIHEEFNNNPDTYYQEMISIAEKDGVLERIYSMPPSEKQAHIFNYLNKTSASAYQMESFFHEKIRKH